jgi:hypothetical protein
MSVAVVGEADVMAAAGAEMAVEDVAGVALMVAAEGVAAVVGLMVAAEDEAEEMAVRNDACYSHI